MGKQAENVKKVHAFLTTLSKIFDSNTFDIHRDTIASLLSITNGTATLCMNSLKRKRKVINFRVTNEREYTVTMIEPSQDICDDVMKYSQEDIKKLDGTSLDNYKKLLEGQKMREVEAQHEGLKRFLEEKRKEQIDNGNKAENALKSVFDELGINYEYQHLEMIEDDEGKEHGYIYDFLVEIGNKKYDVEVDGSSHDGKEEQDKERDALSRSIGIEPRRLPTQMVYLIEYEVRRGLLGKSDLLELIENDYSSIKELWDSVKHWYKKSNESELKAKELNKLIEKANEKAETIKKLEEIINECNETIKGLEAQIKNEDEILDKITNLVHYNVKYDSKKEIRDEITMECFTLSKKGSRQVEANDGEDEQLPF